MLEKALRTLPMVFLLRIYFERIDGDEILGADDYVRHLTEARVYIVVCCLP